MKALVVALWALSAALPAQAQQDAADRAARAGDAAELALLRWRHPVDPRGDLVDAEQLLLDAARTPVAQPLDRTSFDLMAIRRQWEDERLQPDRLR